MTDEPEERSSGGSRKHRLAFGQDHLRLFAFSQTGDGRELEGRSAVLSALEFPCGSQALTASILQVESTSLPHIPANQASSGRNGYQEGLFSTSHLKDSSYHKTQNASGGHFCPYHLEPAGRGDL